MSWTLIRGGHLFAPEDIGIQDLLIIDSRIVAIGADLLGLVKKGRLDVGSDADILILKRSGDVDRVYCRGKLMVKERKPVVREFFED